MFNRVNILWAVLGAIASVFVLGGSAAVFIYSNFEQAGEAQVKASAVDARVTRFREQDLREKAELKAAQDRMTAQQMAFQKQVIDQYTALNSRLDTLNGLLIQGKIGPRKVNGRSPDGTTAFISYPRETEEN